MFTAECIGFMFKRSLTAGAGIAAAAILTFAGIQGSGAVAQESDSAPAIILPQTEVTDEIVPENAPVFVEKEVAQPLPAEPVEAEPALSSNDDAPRATSLRELVALTPNGDTAVMTCKMKEAEGLYGIAVVWEFTLIREDGRWTVTGHVKK